MTIPISLEDFGFLDISLGAALAIWIRYALLAGLAWWLGYRLLKSRWLHRKIVARFPASSEVRREVLYSASSVLIFGLVAGLTIQLAHAGWTQLYFDVAEYGRAWFWLSIPCAVILHDAYFYWTHRLMHHRRLYRRVHHLHHLSRNPSPWAAYAFSPAEAVVEAGIFPLAVMVMPMHPIAFTLFMGVQILFNVIGHTGYEIHPRWLMDSWLGKILNTPTNHAMHHESIRGNFGLYFNVWDRLMGTNHEDYERRFREVTTRKRAPSAEPSAPPREADAGAERTPHNASI